MRGAYGLVSVNDRTKEVIFIDTITKKEASEVMQFSSSLIAGDIHIHIAEPIEDINDDNASMWHPQGVHWMLMIEKEEMVLIPTNWPVMRMETMPEED